MAIIQVQSARNFRHIRAATFGAWGCLAGVFPVRNADRLLCGWRPICRRRIVFEGSMGIHSCPEHIFEDHKDGTSSSYVSAQFDTRNLQLTNLSFGRGHLGLPLCDQHPIGLHRNSCGCRRGTGTQMGQVVASLF